MNTTKYLQTDSRWSGLGYPKSPCTIGNSGCGEVSIVNAIIEMQAYQKYTPATIQNYCKQYAAPNCDGTYHSGIPKMMQRYGLSEVKEHATMSTLWTELAKGDRVAIYLMGSRNAGTKGVHWTGSGHFVCSVDYKYKDGKHYVYMKDSYSNSSLRNGWITYEENMRNAVLKVWSGKLSGKRADGTVVTEVKGTSKVDLDNSKLTVDGIGGKATVKRMQIFFGTTPDGVIDGQLRKFSAYYPALQSVEFGSGGSPCIKAMQKWLALSDPDGYLGSNTTKAWQRKLVSLGYLAKSEKIDGIIGTKTMKAWQECLNNGGKPKGTKKPTTTTTKSIIDKELEACKTQAEWMKNYTYKWQANPTVEKSKKYGTCVTYVACVLQRIGVLKPGESIWHTKSGKVDFSNNKITSSYPKGTLKSLKGQLKRGDIVMVGDKSDTEGGSHILILTGEWTSTGNPYVWDNHSAENIKKGKSGKHAYSGTKKVIAVVRLKTT